MNWLMMNDINGLGADLTDFFNYGFNESTWRAYCLKQRQMREALGLAPIKRSFVRSYFYFLLLHSYHFRFPMIGVKVPARIGEKTVVIPVRNS
jgi:hypothetical protein